MNAAETIQAAIDKLGALRKNAWSETAGQLVFREELGALDMILHSPDEHPEDSIHAFTVHEDSRYPTTGVPDEDTIATGHLLVTLHRTIDAQLAILRHVQKFYQGDLGISTNRLVVDLAQAILGDDS